MCGIAAKKMRLGPATPVRPAPTEYSNVRLLIGRARRRTPANTKSISAAPTIDHASNASADSPSSPATFARFILIPSNEPPPKRQSKAMNRARLTPGFAPFDLSVLLTRLSQYHASALQVVRSVMDSTMDCTGIYAG